MEWSYENELKAELVKCDEEMFEWKNEFYDSFVVSRWIYHAYL